MWERRPRQGRKKTREREREVAKIEEKMRERARANEKMRVCVVYMCVCVAQQEGRRRSKKGGEREEDKLTFFTSAPRKAFIASAQWSRYPVGCVLHRREG